MAHVGPKRTDLQSVYLDVCWRWCALARLPKHSFTSVYDESCVGAVGGVSETCAYSPFTGRLIALLAREVSLRVGLLVEAEDLHGG
jgi:hypothetical protein